MAYNAAVTYAVTGSLKAAAIGAFSSALMPTNNFFVAGVIGGLASKAQGGNFGHGFGSAAAGNLLAGRINVGNPYANVIISAVVGGTVSKLTGGKFSNGAQTWAFQSAVEQDWDWDWDWNLNSKTSDNSNSKSSTSNNESIAKNNLKLIDEAIVYINEEYDDLMKDIRISFKEMNLDGQAIPDSNEIILNSKYIDGSYIASYDFVVELLVHEALHIRVVAVVGLNNYKASELLDIVTLQRGASRFDSRGEIHDWIYTQGELARHYSMLGGRFATKPTITKEAIRARFVND